MSIAATDCEFCNVRQKPFWVRRMRPSPRLIVAYRITVFVVIVWMIHTNHQKWQVQQAIAARNLDSLLDVIRDDVPTATSIVPAASLPPLAEQADFRAANLAVAVDADGNPTALILRSSPLGDHITGFSGPTDLLLIADLEGQIQHVRILGSRDTREHLQKILDDPNFLTTLASQSLTDLQQGTRIDAVSGATLTCLAMMESIRFVLNYSENLPDSLTDDSLTDDSLANDSALAPASLRFPDPPALRDVQLIFPSAVSIIQKALTAESNEQSSALFQAQTAHEWLVLTEDGQALGNIIRTSPSADNIVGYQGPSDTLIGRTAGGEIVGIAVGASYENEPYVDYVREDTYFRKLFNQRTIEQLADMDIEGERIEGVSGATMTSMAVAESLRTAAIQYTEHLRQQQQFASRPQPATVVQRLVTPRNLSTMAITVFGVILGITRLRGMRRLRLLFQGAVIMWLGLLNGDLVSQASLLGWSQAGIPWQNATGLVVLTAAALLVPLASGHNVYCSHICPHGAVQQLIRNRLPWKFSLSAKSQRRLKLIPPALVLWVLAIGILHLPFSPVDIEPFDAWLWTIAGTATITIAVAGLAASAFVPMAYCRFGCPTGAVLNFAVRPRKHGWQTQDKAALFLLISAAILLAA